MAFLERLGDFIWNPWLLGLFLLAGLYCSVRTGFFQLFGLPVWLKTTLGSVFLGSRKKTGRGITQFQALSTALASTIGTGSIAGVATAIFCGGPGAVFWVADYPVHDASERVAQHLCAPVLGYLAEYPLRPAGSADHCSLLPQRQGAE